MNRGVPVLRRWGLTAGMVALIALTACAGPQRDEGPSGSAMTTAPIAGMKDGIPAPVPNAPPSAPEAQRDVVKTATMTITVPDVSAAADKAAVLAEGVGGRVDSRTEDAGSARGTARTSVVLRVPVAKLDEVERDLKQLGTVQHAESTAEDVTSQRVDLDARVKALQTSVDRLLAIMRDAKDPDALITAESALSQRQADLDSLRAQREQLGERIDYSTVDVTFVADQIGGPTPQQYDGFTGQLERGWDGMVSVFGNLILLFGLLLPWLGAVAVLCVLGYGIVRVVRGRRASAPSEATPAPSAEPAAAEPKT